jgi:hypothetical protein
VTVGFGAAVAAFIMNIGKIQVGIASAVVAASATAYVLRAKTNTALQHEIAALQPQQDMAMALRVENRRLASVAAEAAVLGHNDAELAQLAKEVEVQKQRVASSAGSDVRAKQGAQPAQKRPVLSAKTNEAFAKLNPLITEKKWNEAFALLDAIPDVAPDSYDMAMIHDIKAKIYLQMSQYAKAAESMEATLKLADQFNYLDEATVMNTVKLLAQLTYTAAVAMKDKDAQAQAFDRAEAHIARWKKGNPNSTENTTMPRPATNR